MKIPGLPRRRGAGPLGLALLAAVLLHALWLAEAQLRQRRQPTPTRLERADDTPELLVFSRQPPEPLGLETVPLPPPEAIPPPPPLLPKLGDATPKGAAPPRRPGKAPVAIGKRPATAPRATPRLAAVPGSGRRPGPPPLPPLPVATPLEALREALRRGPDSPPPPLEGPALQSWRTLWQSGDPNPAPPPAWAARPAEAEVRRLPLARARAEGVEVESGRLLRLDDQLLLLWIEGDQLWLLRLPA
jgi:hypothetical protein